MKHHTKDKGDLGKFKVQSDLCEKGYIILLPLTEHSEFDLVGYKDGKFKRIQVKYRSINKKGVLEICFKSYWSNKKGIKVKKQDLKNIDWCAVYCPNTDQCYYFQISEMKDVSFYLRINKSKNKFVDQKRIHYAKDYLMI